MGEPFLEVKWQEGPVLEVGINGCQIEEVIAVCIDRLQELNKPPYNTRANSLVITRLEEAIMWLNYRTNERIFRGVEGTSIP